MRIALLTVLLALVAVAPARAGALIDRAAQGLQTSTVYVDPAAQPSIDSDEAARLRRAIAAADAGPVYIAVLPATARDEAGGDSTEVARQLARALGRDGTFAVVVGGQFRAGSTTRSGTGRIADEAFAARGEAGLAATLEEFVARLGGAGSSGGGGGDAGGGSGLLILIAALFGGVGLLTWRSRRRQRREIARQVDELRTVARDDLVALGDDVREVDLDIEMPDADPRAREELAAALDAYERAETMLDHASSPGDFEPITRLIADGRNRMVAVRALLRGEEPPEPAPPCFFDPRHGPAVTQAEFSFDGEAPRPVPVCAADAARLQDGREPHVREVVAGGHAMPYYNAPAYFGPYAGGFFSPFGFGTGFLLPGLLFGGMMGGMFGGGLFGGGTAYGSDDIGGGGFGDFGGGDFGGGDFGGGGFGGGDF